VSTGVAATLGRDERSLILTGAALTEVRAHLRSLGIPVRRTEGALSVPLDQAPALLATDAVETWEPRARHLADNRAEIAARADSVRRAVAAVKAAGAARARRAIADCTIANILDDHQALNVATLMVDGSWGGCVFDEQGTGKTVTLIATFDLLVERNLTDTLMVVAPKSMVAEWKEEFRRFTGDLYRVVVAEGDRRAKASAFFARADVIVVNYETLVSLRDEVVRLAQRTRLTLAVDESFNVKNAEAARSAAARHVREWCTHAFVLCGTPAPNRSDDIVAQFDLVDLGLTFAGLHVDKDRDTAHRQVSHRLTERGLYIRNTKTQVLTDLPPKSFQEVDVELTGHQQAAYEAATRDLILDLQRADDAAYARQIQTFLERRAVLLRICADPTPVVPGYTELPAKVSAIDTLLERLVRDRGEKVLLWSFYRSSLDRLAQRYSHYGLVRVDGTVTDNRDRRDAVRQFQHDPDVKVFLGNPAAAGAGLTLHAARYALYESLSNQAAHYLQSLDRIHRRGQSRDVRYVTLVARGTIEEAEYARLRSKAAIQGDLLGDPPDQPPTRRMLLEELLATVPDVAPHISELEQP
jgi:SNF2 family DNA or RNA helicase